MSRPNSRQQQKQDRIRAAKKLFAVPVPEQVTTPSPAEVTPAPILTIGEAFAVELGVLIGQLDSSIRRTALKIMVAGLREGATVHSDNRCAASSSVPLSTHR